MTATPLTDRLLAENEHEGLHWRRTLRKEIRAERERNERARMLFDRLAEAAADGSTVRIGHGELLIVPPEGSTVCAWLHVFDAP
jgi:hypothetical protein